MRDLTLTGVHVSLIIHENGVLVTWLITHLILRLVLETLAIPAWYYRLNIRLAPSVRSVKLPASPSRLGKWEESHLSPKNRIQRSAFLILIHDSSREMCAPVQRLVEAGDSISTCGEGAQLRRKILFGAVPRASGTLSRDLSHFNLSAHCKLRS